MLTFYFKAQQERILKEKNNVSVQAILSSPQGPPRHLEWKSISWSSRSTADPSVGLCPVLSPQAPAASPAPLHPFRPLPPASRQAGEVGLLQPGPRADTP